MKTIVAALLALAIAGGLAGQASAAAGTSTLGPSATLSVASAEHDYPDFGSQQWWQLQQDMG